MISLPLSLLSLSEKHANGAEEIAGHNSYAKPGIRGSGGSAIFYTSTRTYLCSFYAQDFSFGG